MTIDQDKIDEFKASIRGNIIQPGDEDYDGARAIYNAMIDKKPRLLVCVADIADVMASVAFGTKNNVPIAVRGGGHNGPGLGTCDDGMMIDLKNLKGIRVNPESKTVRVGPGHTQGDVDHASHPFGLHVPAGIVSTTGISGLTLGGGHGYLSRKYGLTIDNLLEADVVLADGTFVTASKTSNPDLFWALRGGGGNFGIVTSFLFQAQPVSTIFGGPIFFAQEDAGEVMKFYRDYMPKQPKDFYSVLGLKTVPSTAPFPEAIWGRKICALIICYDGPTKGGEAHVKEILDALPDPIFNFTGPMPFTALQTLFDPLLPPGMQWYWKGDFVKEISDEAINAHLSALDKTPSELSLMHLYPIDGAVHSVGPNETAWSCRDAKWSMVIAAIDPDPSRADELKSWAKNYWEATHPYNMEGAYVNFMGEDETEGRVKATYGGNYEKLVRVKNKYDPSNVFRINHNIKPTVDSKAPSSGMPAKSAGEAISQ